MNDPNNFVPVTGIRLHKSGKYTIVDAEIGGTWIEVIRERSDGEFCHIVEPDGMFSRYYSAWGTTKEQAEADLERLNQEREEARTSHATTYSTG